jgi:hypothetical protein
MVANGPPSWIASGWSMPAPGLNPLMREFEKPAISFQPSALSLSVPNRTSFDIRFILQRHKKLKAES